MAINNVAGISASYLKALAASKAAQRGKASAAAMAQSLMLAKIGNQPEKPGICRKSKSWPRRSNQ